MKRMMLALSALMILGLASEAGAQNATAPAPPPAGAAVAVPAGAAGGGVEYKKKTVYDFDDDLVEGDLIRPDGDLVDSRRAAKHSSLIRIRPDFIPELLKSVESI